MASHSLIDELQLDLEEYVRLEGICERSENKQRLANEIQRIKTEILKAKVRNETLPTVTQQFPIELTSFSFNQSSKFVKVFVVLDGVRNAVEDDAVVTTFMERSMSLRVRGMNGKDYELDITYLLHDIVPTESFHTIKTNMIVIHGCKKDEAIEWSELTSVTKQLKDIEQAQFDLNVKATAGMDGDDPYSNQFRLMCAMKQIYETGSPKLRRVIAHACADSADRIQRGVYDENE